MPADFLSRTVTTKDEQAAELDDDSGLVFTLGSASEQDTPVTPSVRQPPGGRRTTVITWLHPATLTELLAASLPAQHFAHTMRHHAFHAFTGTDINTERFSRIGKATWLQVCMKADRDLSIGYNMVYS